MKPIIIKEISGSDEKIPEDADQETKTTGMACRGLHLDDRVIFHNLSRCTAGFGILPAPTPLAVYPDRTGRNNPGYSIRLAVVSLAR